MPTDCQSDTPPQHLAVRTVLRMRRVLLACLGVICVALGAIGVVVPGLPTTIFLIIATACFMRSCPWLQRVLIQNRFFGPFLKYLEPGAAMPVRAKVLTIVVMWVAIGVSVALLSHQHLPMPWVGGAIVLAGVLGTIGVLRISGSPTQPSAA